MYKLSFFKLAPLLITLIFFFSCEKENEFSQKSVIEESVEELECFSVDELEITKTEHITEKFHENYFYNEYAVHLNGHSPIFFNPNYSGQEVALSSRIVTKNSAEDLTFKKFFMIISALEDVSGHVINDVTINNMPREFTGDLYIFDYYTSEFVEAYTFENGVRTGTYRSSLPSLCDSEDVVGSRNDDCYMVAYPVQRARNVETTTIYEDVYQIGGDGSIKFLYTKIKDVVHSFQGGNWAQLEYWYCPENLTHSGLPPGDEIGGIPPGAEADRDNCHKLKVEMLKDIKDPCNPDKTSVEIITEALGGNFNDCQSPQYLLDGIENYMNNRDCSDFFLKSEILQSPKTPINNIKQALKDCFGENHVDCNSFSGSLSVTLYVDQPTANSRASWDLYDDDGNLTVDVGHAFLGLNMEEGGENTTLVTGLYPSGPVMPGDPKTGLSLPAFGDDGGREFSVAITFELTCEEFNQVLSSIAGASNPGPGLNNYYDLNSNNCSDYAMNHLNQIGLNIPDTRGTWPGGAGSNPGDLGEDLKDYNNPDANYSLDSNGGNAPESNCL